MNEAVIRDQTGSRSQHSECLPQPRDELTSSRRRRRPRAINTHFMPL